MVTEVMAGGPITLTGERKTVTLTPTKRVIYGIEVDFGQLKALRASSPGKDTGTYMEWLEAELLRTRELVRDCYAHSSLAGEDGLISDRVRTAMDEWGMRHGGDE